VSGEAAAPDQPVALTPEHDEPGAFGALHGAVLEGLLAHNRRFAPPPDVAPLGVAARDASGALAGGVVGHTTWAATGEGWLYVELLWVAETHRGLGVGSRLLAAAEAEAARRGCRHAYLSTFGFQARPFYERHGYAVFGVQEDFPPGSRRYWLRRTFGAGAGHG
jgi:GNAT superfamily N-acetyltransferase